MQLSLGHDKGVSNIVVPGAGEPNFDSFVASPFETTKQVGFLFLLFLFENNVSFIKKKNR